MGKMLYVATVVKTHIMEFHIPYLKMLKDIGWETDVAARNDYDDPQDCSIPYCDHYFNIPFERNPFKWNNVRAYKKLKKIISEGDYDIVHCHTPVGACIARIAIYNAHKKCKVFYTAHGFHFYNGAPFINWIVYYPIERCLAHLTDVLITINKEDYNRARSFKAHKVVYVPGVGLDISRFSNYVTDRNEKRNQMGIPLDARVLLSVGEINTNKNHKIIIELLPDLKNCWYVICGQGPLMKKYKALSKKIGVDGRVLFVGYRDDVIDFYGMSDVFVFPSLREGLPIALLEAIASGLPCAAAKNRGTADIEISSKTLFDANDKQDAKRAVEEALKSEASNIVNISRIMKFDISNTLDMVKMLYLEEIDLSQ